MITIIICNKAKKKSLLRTKCKREESMRTHTDTHRSEIMHTKCTLHENEANEQNGMNERQRKRTWSNTATNKRPSARHAVQENTHRRPRWRRREDKTAAKNYILKSCNRRNESAERCCRSEQENMLKRTSGVTLWRWEGGPQYNTSHIIGRWFFFRFSL